MMYVILEVNAETDWWDTLPDNVRKDVEVALAESEKGRVISHEEIQKQYQKWLVK